MYTKMFLYYHSIIIKHLIHIPPLLMFRLHHSSESMLKRQKLGKNKMCEGVGGHGVHLSSRTPQEDTFRHRSACRTPAENREEYLTSGKEYIDPRKTQ